MVKTGQETSLHAEAGRISWPSQQGEPCPPILCPSACHRPVGQSSKVLTSRVPPSDSWTGLLALGKTSQACLYLACPVGTAIWVWPPVWSGIRLRPGGSQAPFRMRLASHLLHICRERRHPEMSELPGSKAPRRKGRKAWDMAWVARFPVCTAQLRCLLGKGCFDSQGSATSTCP